MNETYGNANDQIETKQIIGYIFVAVLIVLGVKSNIFTIMAFVILFLYFIFASDCKTVEALVFFLAFMNIFKLNPSSTSLFTYLQLIPITKILIKQHQLQKNTFIMSSILALYAVMITIINGSSTSVLIRFVVEVALLLALFGTDVYLSFSQRNLVIFYSLGVLVSSIFGKMNSILPEINSYLTVLYVRIDSSTIAYRFSGLIANSNYYSIEVSVALACLLILYIKNLIGKSFYAISVPLIIFGLMSQSKTFVISLILLALVYISYFSTHKNISRIFSGIIFALLALIAFSSVIGSFVDLYFARFLDIFSEETTMSSFTTGRWDIWSYYIDEFSSSWSKTLLGYGLEANAQIGPAHNIFIQSIYCIGLIGSFIFVGWIISFRKCNRDKRYIIVLIVLLGMRLFAANLLFYPNLYYYLLLLFVLLYCNGNQPHHMETEKCLKNFLM